MKINFLVHMSACMDFFFRVKSISSFFADCFFQQRSTQMWQDWHLIVLKWIIRVRFYTTILTIRRYACSLKLWNKVLSNKFQTWLFLRNKWRNTNSSWWKSPTKFCFLADTNQKFSFKLNTIRSYQLRKYWSAFVQMCNATIGIVYEVFGDDGWSRF